MTALSFRAGPSRTMGKREKRKPSAAKDTSFLHLLLVSAFQPRYYCTSVNCPRFVQVAVAYLDGKSQIYNAGT